MAVLTVAWKTEETEESLLFSWKTGIDPGLPIGPIAAIAGSIDAATRKADLLRTHQWELMPVCAGELLALQPPVVCQMQLRYSARARRQAKLRIL